MRFAEVDIYGVYLAPIVPMLLAAWLVTIVLRRIADRCGVMRHAWHPALLTLAVFVIVLWSIMSIVVTGRFHAGG